MTNQMELEKLGKLLPHWIEHNQNHAAEYKKWAAVAKENGLEKTASLIEHAIARIGEADDALNKALKEME